MAKKTIKAQMKQRRDTKANWEATNPVLLDGELGIVSDDPNLYKVGDGTTAWNALPFRGFDGTLAQELGTSPNAAISQKVVSEKLTELESAIEISTPIGTYATIKGSKIEYYGDVTSGLSGFNIVLFKVEPNKQYRIHNTIVGTASTPSYAIYSSDNLSQETALVIGEPINSYQDNKVVTTPDNAAFIAVQYYNSQYGVSEVESIKDILPEIVKLIGDNLGYGDSIKSSSKVSGYIYYDGSIDNNISFDTILYPVEPNTQYWVYSDLRSGVARMYAIYSSDSLVPANVLSIGMSVSDEREDSILITTPDNAAYIAISAYKESANAVYLTKELSLKETDADVQSLKNVIDSYSSKGNQRMVATLDIDGENLYVAYLDESLTEFVYWFKRCMFNELYTFYRVGYRKVERNYPSTEGIDSLSGVTIINKTSSDNIGPILFKNGRWAGGNHSWNSDNETKTARTESYAIYADGVQIKAGESKYADKVVVKVVNTIYNPAVLPSSVVPISTEYVDYSVCKNTIEVSVKQQFANIDNPVERYYGMQSMFEYDQKLLVPNGGVNDWIDTPSDYFIEKANFPKVNRFIEGNNNVGAYQSTYLKPNKDGNHQMVSTTIFNHSYTKSYHYVIDGETIVAGKKVVWSGAYSFFNKPIQDDSNVFAYSGVINGKDAIYINAKRAFEGCVELPSQYMMKSINIVEKDDTIITDNVFVDADGIAIKASGVGSMIIILD